MLFANLLHTGYDVELLSHAEAILSNDFPTAVQELEIVLESLSIPAEMLVRSGGGETKATQGLRLKLAARHWKKHNFRIEKSIDGKVRESTSHEIDHVRELPPNGTIAMEIEWNNKDPFFDRDLENFKRLHAEGAISVGIILTRGRSLQTNLRSLLLKFATNKGISDFDDLKTYGLTPTPRQVLKINNGCRAGEVTFAESWASVFCSDKYGQATTHWRKLEDRLHRGVGNPCPLLLIGIPDTVVTYD
jgi:hypothetical protein